MTEPQHQLKLFNTLTREKEVFKPLDIDAQGNAQSVRMYLCGITPYDYAHIGNLRTIVVFDVLYRLLRHLYPNKVEFVRNYTDIDDKIVQRAAETGKEPFALADEFITIFERDLAAMNVLDLPRAQKPRVSDYLREIVAMVDGLLHKGYAYVTDSGDVMLDVVKFNGLGGVHKPFGYLERRTFDNLQARVEEDAEKRDPRDFPVWKANSKSATKMEQAFLPQELGATYAGFNAAGRPGWHIECSVMSEQLLGKSYKPGHAALFDIHGGGEDLKFPHHSCEIAQTEAFHPECTMSSVWMHVSFLTVEGQKMSKSLGNFVLVEDALKKYSPEAIRLWLLQTHYRKPVDYSDEALQAAENAFKGIKDAIAESCMLLHSEPKIDKGYLNGIVDTLHDDLNINRFLVEIFDIVSRLRFYSAHIENIKQMEIHRDKAYTLIDFLGFKFSYEEPVLEQDVLDLLQEREEARKNKDWARSDDLRDKLRYKGIDVFDKREGQIWRKSTY